MSVNGPEVNPETRVLNTAMTQTADLAEKLLRMSLENLADLQKIQEMGEIINLYV